MHRPDVPGGTGRVLVVSHPAVLSINRAVYARLGDHGWDPTIVVPKRWRHDYRPARFDAEPGGSSPDVEPIRVLRPGRPQRHLYLTRPLNAVRRLRPSVVFLEEEPVSVAAYQWGRAAVRARVPFGVKIDENLDRPYPLPARMIRRWVLEHAAFVVARSPSAAETVRTWGYRGEVRVVPYAVPDHSPVAPAERDTFTVGYAGRLVPEKGVDDLVAAVRAMDDTTRLLLVGDGPLRTVLENAMPGRLEIRSGVRHEDMPQAYAEMDVLVLPSRTTPRWREQFGRVLIEALACDVPIVGSDSGSIPWVITTTGGGHTFREGDRRALARTLADLRDDPDLRRSLAARGREAVGRRFSTPAAASELDAILRPAADRRAGADPRPSVALVAHGIHDHGGMERSLSELVTRGHGAFRFTVYAATLAPELRPLVRWKRVPVPPRPIPLKIFLFAVVCWIRMRTDRTDLVHTCGAIVPVGADVASVHLCHAVMRRTTGHLAPPRTTLLRRLNTALAQWLALRLERHCYRPDRVAVLAAVSEAVVAHVRRHYPDVPVEVTPNGVDGDRFRPDPGVREEVRGRLAIPPGRCVVLFVGGDWYRKRVREAIEGVANAVARGADVALWVVGRGDRRRFQAAAGRLGIADRVTFFDFRADTERFYQAADVLLLPSLYETAPLVALEAAAAGLPLVATGVGSIPALIGDRAAGIIIRPDPPSIADAIVELASDEAVRVRMGREARRRAAPFTWEASTRSVMDLYRRLLERNDERVAAP